MVILGQRSRDAQPSLLPDSLFKLLVKNRWHGCKVKITQQTQDHQSQSRELLKLVIVQCGSTEASDVNVTCTAIIAVGRSALDLATEFQDPVLAKFQLPCGKIIWAHSTTGGRPFLPELSMHMHNS